MGSKGFVLTLQLLNVLSAPLPTSIDPLRDVAIIRDPISAVVAFSDLKTEESHFAAG